MRHHPFLSSGVPHQQISVLQCAGCLDVADARHIKQYGIKPFEIQVGNGRPTLDGKRQFE
jgi:hypothetical protein